MSIQSAQENIHYIQCVDNLKQVTGSTVVYCTISHNVLFMFQSWLHLLMSTLCMSLQDTRNKDK